MKTAAAVLYQMEKAHPYVESRPLKVGEVELEGPGQGEVLIEVSAAGLCHSDLSVIDGSRPRPVPMVLGHEASGVVREVGPGVTDLKPGDHVVFSFVPLCGRCSYCAVGRPALCANGNAANVKGTLLGGAIRFRDAKGESLYHHLGVSAFSRFTVSARESLIPIPPEFPLEKAALFGCAVLTGVGAVINTAKVEPGARVAVFGLGGIGLNVLLGARLVSALQIIAVDVVPTKLKLAKELGATHTLNAGESDVVAAVKDLTSGGADVAFEAVGDSQVLVQAYRATRRGGKTVTIGLAHPQKQFSIPQVSLVAEERTILGSYMGSAVPQRDIPRLLQLNQAGKLPVEDLLSRQIKLDEINEAFDALHEGSVVRQVCTF